MQVLRRQIDKKLLLFSSEASNCFQRRYTYVIPTTWYTLDLE